LFVIESTNVKDDITPLLSVAVAVANTGKAGQSIVVGEGNGFIIGIIESPSIIVTVLVRKQLFVSVTITL